MKHLLSFFILALCCASASGKPLQSYLDVPPSHPFYNQIEEMAARGIMIGYGGGIFDPDAPLLRYQAAVVLERAIGVFVPPETNTSHFDDVDYEDYYKNFVEDFAARGITNGCGVRLFCPYDSTTREQFAVFIMRSLGEFSPSYSGSFRFDDVPESSFYFPFIHRLKELGITNGCDADSYCPTGIVTRAHCAAFISRAFPQ